MASCNMASYRCVDHAASRAFYKFGKLIARHRLVFLISPCFVMLILSTGISQLRTNTNIEYLFTRDDCQSLLDGKYVQEHFPIGTEGGDLLQNRELDLFQRRGRVIALAKDGKSMLRQDTMRELFKLDERIRAFNVTFNHTKFSYADVCQHFMEKCSENEILKFYQNRLDEFENLTLAYPIGEFPTLFGQKIPAFVAPNLGAVKVDPDTDVVKYVKAIRLFYPLGTGPDDDKLAELWEEEFLKVNDALQDEWSSINVLRSTSVTFTQEVDKASSVALPRFVATFCMLVLFAVCSSIMRDWVLSKPWLAFIGVISASFSIVSSMGMLSILGLEYNEIVSLMPFLILGVGVDNMFIMIAAWRHLSLYLSVEERTGRTYSEAGVSITITNTTTILAFIIGASSSLPGVRTFCIYSGVAMFFVYFYQMTFFGAAMALFGQREANNLHCYTCKKVLPREESPNKLYLLFCSGGISMNNHKGYNIDLEHRIIKFFRLYYGPFITHPCVKALILISYLVYLGGAIYGCTQIEEGMVMKNLASDNSPSYKFYDIEDVDFREIGPPVSVIFKDEIPYWNEQVQDHIENLTQKFEALDMAFGEHITQSWLRDFRQYWTAYNHYMPEPAPPGKEGFMSVLTEHFLRDPRYQMYQLDIELEEDEGSGEQVIKTSRFIIQTKNVFSLNDERELLLNMREVAESSNLSVLAHHPAFALYESYIGILPNLLQTLGIALGSMFIVAIILIPHPICAILVTLCIVSIDSCVIGYMSLWNVNVDTISMVNIILCIGFSVDFSAHITYAFVVAPKADANSRAQYALHSLGMAILQGALSSIIAISALSTAPVYIFRTFFKTLFLVMLFGAFHGLLFLPIFLTFVSRFIPHKIPEEDKHDDPVAEQQTTAFLNTIPVKSTPGEGKKTDWRVTAV